VSYIPRKGDVVRINFDPSVGKEIMKYRPALVLTPEKFNDQMGLVLVVPISSTVRGIGLEVQCPKPMSTTGVAQTWQMSSFDWVEHQAKFVEKSPKRFLDKVIRIVGLLVGLN
jgi:mRNA interferase ChpB